jgi:hypothetical protein
MHSILDLSVNRLSGTLPNEISALNRLLRMNLTANALSGTIPSQLSTFTAVSYVPTQRCRCALFCRSQFRGVLLCEQGSCSEREPAVWHHSLYTLCPHQADDAATGL